MKIHTKTDVHATPITLQPNPVPHATPPTCGSRLSSPMLSKPFLLKRSSLLLLTHLILPFLPPPLPSSPHQMPIATSDTHPSPIPRATDSRSAANQCLTHYPDNAVRCPDLSLPESHFSVMAHTLVPAEIEYRSLSTRVDAVLKSVKEFGAFRIRGHGITGQELGKMEQEAALWNIGGEVIPCVRCRRGTLQFMPSKSFALHSHPNFWIHMGKVARTLESIVEQVRVAVQEHSRCELKQRIQETETESLICLCRYPHGNANVGETDVNNNARWCDYALRFYLPLQHCIFYVQSGRGPLSFDAGPDTIVVTIGKQLEEWSQGQFKSVAAEMIFMPSLHSKQQQQASLSIELMLFRSNSLNQSHNILSLSDQILILLCLSFLCKFLLFLFSH